MREVAAEEESDDVVWGTCVIDELQDIDAAEKKRESEAKKSAEGKAVNEPALTAKPWRKKIQGGHRLKFVLDSGAVKTIVPKDAIPGMKLDKSKGGSFRVASGEVLPNLGPTKLEGVGTLNGSPVKIGTQVADITKPLASVDEMVTSGMMVIMHRTGGIAKRLSVETERKIRDLVKGEKGNEVVLERQGGSFTFEIDVKDSEGWKTPKKTARASTQMDVSEASIEKSYYDALWEDEYEELECMPCGAAFHRH